MRGRVGTRDAAGVSGESSLLRRMWTAQLERDCHEALGRVGCVETTCGAAYSGKCRARTANRADGRIQWRRRHKSGDGDCYGVATTPQPTRYLMGVVRTQCRGSAAGCSVRMARAPRECRPDFMVDGFEASNSTSLDMPVVGIVAMEVYRTLSETPLQFLRTDNQCGTIVICTRSGPR